MRKLHPIGPHEVLVRQGRFRNADGTEVSFTLHAAGPERSIVRVEEPDGALWHLTLDAVGAPERLEARLLADDQHADITLTCFDDEVLVWRRGAEPASEAVAIPPGYRILWPPVAGRDVCLVPSLPVGTAPAAIMCALVRRQKPAQGWLSIRPVKFTLRRTPDGFALDTPGLRPMRAVLDGAGRLQRWDEGVALSSVAVVPD